MANTLNSLNESFEKLFEGIEDNWDEITAEPEDCRYKNPELYDELHDALDDADEEIARDPQRFSGWAIVKKYENDFLLAINNVYPDASWWDVTSINIFADLLDKQDANQVIDDIINNLKPGFKSKRQNESLRSRRRSLTESKKCDKKVVKEGKKCNKKNCKDAELKVTMESCRGSKCTKKRKDDIEENCRKKRCKKHDTEDIIETCRGNKCKIKKDKEIEETCIGGRCRRRKNIDEMASRPKRANKKSIDDDRIKENKLRLLAAKNRKKAIEEAFKEMHRRKKLSEAFLKKEACRIKKLQESIEEANPTTIFTILDKAYDLKNNIILRLENNEFNFAGDFVKKWGKLNNLNVVEFDVNSLQNDLGKGDELKITADFLLAFDKENTVVLIDSSKLNAVDNSINDVINALMDKKFASDKFEVLLDNVVMVVQVISNVADPGNKAMYVTLTESIIKKTFKESHRISNRNILSESVIRDIRRHTRHRL